MEPVTKEAVSRWAFLTRWSVACLLLVLFGIAARLPALQGELIWDDHLLVENNPMIRSPLLIGESFRHYLFPDAFNGHYRPVQTASYIFDYYFWRTDTFGYHLSNICWHLASGVALYFLLRRLLPTLAVAFSKDKIASLTALMVSLLWIVHPVHSAAVDYISGRADSLAFFFAATAWLLYLRARELRRPSLQGCMYSLAPASGLLALCSRESGLIWMLLFLCQLLVVDRAVTLRSKLVALTVCLLIAGAYGGLRSLPESRPETTVAAAWNATTQGTLMMRALGDYARLVFFPTNLHLERSVAGRAGGEYLALGGVAALVLLLYGAWRKGPGQKVRLFGATWFLISFLPISNFFRLNATVAEHWLYLPSVGILLFLAGIILDFPVRYRRVAVSATCLAAVALTARSAVRSSDWVDAETFFRRTFAAGGSNSRIGVNLAGVYARRGEHAKAEEILRKVLERSPQYALARSNLALALSQQGKTEEAASMFQAASAPRSGNTAAHERTWDAALHLARMQHAAGKSQDALGILAEARQEFPGTWQLIKFEVELRRTLAGPDAALPLVEKFVRDNWWHAGASLSLALLYLETGDLARGDVALQHASRLDVYDARALNLRATIALQQNRTAQAYALQRCAIARQPDEPRQYLILADILTRMGRNEDANALVAEVSRRQAAAAAQAAL